MIRIDAISKQNGHQILFIEASMVLQRGEKAGLVGPNGAGKTTLFRMITGQERPDEGQVSTDAGVTIGYFSQDVGEMSGRSAVAEVMEGRRPGQPRWRRNWPSSRRPWARSARTMISTPSSRATARCRGATRSSTAMRWRARRARCSPG